MGKSFLENCDIKLSEVMELGYVTAQLEEIYKNFKKKKEIYNELGQYIVKIFLQNYNEFHSIKFRVKSPESLIKKIIQKKKKGISVSNYENEINDLLGVRIILLNREGRKNIHQLIDDNRHLKEKIVYYSSEDDSKTYIHFFKKDEIQKKEGGYSSIHYIIKTTPTKNEFNVEIQVRSLLEEVWGEIEHLRYKNNKPIPKNDAINVVFDKLHLLVEQGNEIISLISRYYKDKPLVKDMKKLIRFIKEMPKVSEEEKKVMIAKLQGNIDISFSEYIKMDFSNLSKQLAQFKEINKKIIENISNDQKTYKESMKKMNESLYGSNFNPDSSGND